MPTYVYECDACSAAWDEHHPIAERSRPTELPCPHCHAPTVTLGAAAPAIGDGYRLGRRNLPSTWTDTLSRIKSSHRGSSINTYGAGKREL